MLTLKFRYSPGQLGGASMQQSPLDYFALRLFIFVQWSMFNPSSAFCFVMSQLVKKVPMANESSIYYFAAKAATDAAAGAGD